MIRRRVVPRRWHSNLQRVTSKNEPEGTGLRPSRSKQRPGASYLIKLVSLTDAKDQIVIFVRGGENYATKVPLGRYYVRIATGTPGMAAKTCLAPGRNSSDFEPRITQLSPKPMLSNSEGKVERFMVQPLASSVWSGAIWSKRR